MLHLFFHWSLVCAATCIGFHTRSIEVAVVTSSVVMIPGLPAPLPLLFFLHLAELSLETVGELEGAFRGSSPSSLSGPQAAATRALSEDKRLNILQTLSCVLTFLYRDTLKAVPVGCSVPHLQNCNLSTRKMFEPCLGHLWAGVRLYHPHIICARTVGILTDTRRHHGSYFNV